MCVFALSSSSKVLVLLRSESIMAFAALAISGRFQVEGEKDGRLQRYLIAGNRGNGSPVLRQAGVLPEGFDCHLFLNQNKGDH